MGKEAREERGGVCRWLSVCVCVCVCMCVGEGEREDVVNGLFGRKRQNTKNFLF